MPISQPVYTNTLSSPPRSSSSPAAPASPPPSCTACPPVDGQVLRDSLLKLQPVKSQRCSGLPALLLPPVTAGVLVRLFPLDNNYIYK